MSEGGFHDPAGVNDAALNLSITECARVEAATAGQRLSYVAELVTRRLGSELAAARERWGCDPTDSCAAEISADLTISHRKAIAMMHQGVDLRDRIPLIGDLLRRGDISAKVATTASWRTRLIQDPEILARVDAEVAAVATRFGRYAEDRFCDAIDARIEKYDRDAVRRFRTAAQGLDVRFGKVDDDTGTRSVFGRMSVVDAALSDRRIEAMVKAVCPADPRSAGERRTAAWGIIAAGGDVLPCLCEAPDCEATGPDARGTCLEILVLTDDPDAGAGVDDSAQPPPDPDNPDDDDRPTYDPDYDWERHWPEPENSPDDEGADCPDDEADEPESAEPAADSTAPPAAPCGYTTILAGGGIIPAPLLADLRRMGASVRSVVNPQDLSVEVGYRPSIAAQRLVRARDMTCRFPGCDRPAEYCDLDHTTPHGFKGVTHPGNIKALCRKHHLLKTFWVGEGGWSDEQLADGTIVWTSPSGLEHRAPPGSRIYFPNWDPNTPLPETSPVAVTEQVPGRELRMPQRKRTRAQQRAASITAERQRNHEAREDTDPPPC